MIGVNGPRSKPQPMKNTHPSLEVILKYGQHRPPEFFNGITFLLPTVVTCLIIYSIAFLLFLAYFPISLLVFPGITSPLTLNLCLSVCFWGNPNKNTQVTHLVTNQSQIFFWFWLCLKHRNTSIYTLLI